MNFFKSILLDDPESPKSKHSDESDSNSAVKSPNHERQQRDTSQDETDGGWSFGGLIKTFSTRSESVIETYRRDLREFGLGVRKESEIIREAAGRAVKDLPASLEAGASAAHGALDGVIKSTADLISKETQALLSDVDSETTGANRSLNSARYSRFEAQLSAIQNDLNTFREEPEDVEEYKKWKLEFKFNEKGDEIEGLIGENGTMDSVYRKIVPNEIDHETFWCRYFYRVDKLKQQERMRANIVKRAISVDDDEELSWEVDDEEDLIGSESVKVKDVDGTRNKEVSDGGFRSSEKLDHSNILPQDENESTIFKRDDGDMKNVAEPSKNIVKQEFLGKKDVKSDEIAEVKNDGDDVKNQQIVENKNDGDDLKDQQIVEKKNDEKKGEEGEDKGGDRKKKDDEKAGEESKGKKSEGGKQSDVSQVSIHKSKVEEEEDLGWDEIEDIGSDDGKKTSATTSGGSPKKVDLSKRLSAADDDEDLNWDIEDDDEPSKA